LREDNADLRLTEAGRRLGVVDDVRWDAFNRKRDAIGREQGAAQVHLGHSPNPWLPGLPSVCSQTDRARVLPHGSLEASRVGYASLAELSERGAFVGDGAVASQVEFKPNTKGTSSVSMRKSRARKRYETMALPRDLDYENVRGCRSKCSRN